MHIFHKWSKWADTKKTEVFYANPKELDTLKRNNAQPTTVFEIQQERRCSDCNMVEVRMAIP